MEVVVFGVAKNVSSYQIATYAEKQGIKIINCELLTKWTEARSNTFKLTIKAHHTEIALSNSIWPCGVGVRRFKRKKDTAYKKTPPVRTIKTTKQNMISPRGNNTGNSRFESLNARYPPDLIIRNRFQPLYGGNESHISYV